MCSSDLVLARSVRWPAARLVRVPILTWWSFIGVVAIDANGNKLADGDTVTLIKDLKVKGAPKDLKQGTRVKNIRIVEGDHNIDCKIDGFGAMKLKSEFVKKI